MSSPLPQVFRRAICAASFGAGSASARWPRSKLLRLARAATLLTESDLPITAVARTCGFADADHFSHRFRRVYSNPPGRYRQTTGVTDPSAPLVATGLLPIAAHLLGVTRSQGARRVSAQPSSVRV